MKKADLDRKRKIMDHLSGFVTEKRLTLFNRVLQNRTRYLAVVLEDIYQPHNASAVLRSCDCFGVQDVHIIENQNAYEINPDVALGAYKWLTMTRYAEGDNNTLEAFRKLRSSGYSIVATSPHEGDYSLEEFPLDRKPAFVFGTELNGLSATAMAHADAYVRIPMFGFTESFNISVSASIILHHMTQKLRKSTIDWKLSEEEMIDIKLDWLRNSIKRSDLIEKQFGEFY